MRSTAAKRVEFYDCQDDLRVIAAYEDIGVGPAVVFDGAGFTNPTALRQLIADLGSFADWLDGQLASPRKDPDHD